MIEMFAAFRLAAHPSTADVIINVPNPGLVRTGLSRQMKPEFQAYFSQLVEAYGRTAEDASKTFLHAAGAGRESHGKYLSDCQIKQ